MITVVIFRKYNWSEVSMVGGVRISAGSIKILIVGVLSLSGVPDGEWISMHKAFAQTQRNPMPTPPPQPRAFIPMPTPPPQPAIP
jgi:hypothetical protein